MIKTPQPLHMSLAAALSLGLAACSGGDDDTGSVTPPDGLGEVCAAETILGHLTPSEPANYLAIRADSEFSDDGQTEVEVWGEPCAEASDSETCLSTLAETWPSSSGWGYCGEGCTDYGLAYTRGDEVGMADSVEEVVTFLGAIDSPADAMMVARAGDYKPECLSVEETPTGWEMTAEIMTSDCPWTDEIRRISVDASGVVAVEEVLEVLESDGCAGRRPDGLSPRGALSGSAVGCQLAHIAHLEGAAVIAFERMAVELERFGAPAELVERARSAARDEVRHARQVGRLARAYGAALVPVEVEPMVERDLLSFALENAAEGCVRETYGVVDAMYRSRCATDARVRSVFARIAEDESRHAELSWAIHRWLGTRLSESELAQVDEVMVAAHATLREELERSGSAPLRALGAPPVEAKVAMADVLAERLAA